MSKLTSFLSQENFFYPGLEIRYSYFKITLLRERERETYATAKILLAYRKILGLWWTKDKDKKLGIYRTHVALNIYPIVNSFKED